MKKNSRLEIRISEEKKAALLDLANKNNITVSKLLNNLIDLILEDEKDN